jgi:hypothetical protein
MPASFWRALSEPGLSSSAEQDTRLPSETPTGKAPPPFLLVRLTSVAVAAPLLVRAGLPRLQKWLEPRRYPSPPDPGEVDLLAAQFGRWVDAIIRRGHPIVRPGCLTRGVTLYDGLRHAGLEVELCFGVGSDQGSMAGHCWLDLDGQPLLEKVDPRSKFTEVVRLSRSGVTH